jgi:hypothetical protein
MRRRTRSKHGSQQGAIRGPIAEYSRLVSRRLPIPATLSGQRATRKLHPAARARAHAPDRKTIAGENSPSHQ